MALIIGTAKGVLYDGRYGRISERTLLGLSLWQGQRKVAAMIARYSRGQRKKTVTMTLFLQDMQSAVAIIISGRCLSAAK